VFNGTNLGIGVTPSANWTASGSQKALQLGEYAALSGSGVGGSYYQTVLGLNCVDHTTGTKYLNNGYATAYIQDTGRHYWNIAGVGTAGNAVSFTSAMFLTEAGRLGIATTTPTSLLSVGTLGTTSAPAITLGSSVSGFGSLYFGDGTGADTYRGYIEYAHADDCLSFGTSSTERMRIVAGGNVGIGTTAPAYKLQVRGADATAVFSVGNLTEDTKLEIATFQDDRVLFRATDSSNLARSFAFETGTTERMRLTDAGNLGIGINSNNYRLNVRGGGTVGDSSVYAQFTTLDTGTANSDGFVIGVGTGSSPNANIIQQENAAIVFFTNATERARFSADGALGLGTSNPNAKLEVSLPSVTSGTVALFSSPSYESVRIFAGLSNGIGTVSTSPFGFSTNSTVRFQVGGSGQFGIGASPDYGLSGQVLTSGGASAAPTWANAGKVLQVVQGTSGSQATTTSGNWDSTGLTASITPTSSSSKILVIVSGGMEGGAGGSGDQSIGFKVYRGASSIEASTKGKVIYAGPNVYVPINFVALDSPATTSSTAYTLHFKRISGDTTASFCRDSLETANIVLMEIAA
jgi:hypothetical protein